MIKTCLAGAMALALDFGTTPAFTHNPYIEKISCDQGTGTGFKLSTGQWVSVNHVTEMTNCTVDGRIIIVTHADPIGDFSLFTVPGDKRKGGIKPDCEGFKPGWYHGQGHAKGLPIITSISVLYSEIVQRPNPRGWATLIYQRFIPGQSGGPVLNQKGEATGTVNAFLIYAPGSLSKPLKDTPVCRI